jgi:hypothetical protein
MNEESAVWRLSRWFWWPACLTPPLVLLASWDNGRKSRSADEAMGLAFILFPWLVLLFLWGAAIVVLAARTRTLSSRERSLLSTLGISPAAITGLVGWNDARLGWNAHRTLHGTAGALALTVIWVIAAVWFRRAAWPPGADEP